MSVLQYTLDIHTTYVLALYIASYTQFTRPLKLSYTLTQRITITGSKHLDLKGSTSHRFLSEENTMLLWRINIERGGGGFAYD